jgi:hypothetical protein
MLHAPTHTRTQGEQHGFRQAASIRSALEGELFFYGRVLGFPATYSPDLQPMTIDNLDGQEEGGKEAEEGRDRTEL